MENKNIWTRLKTIKKYLVSIPGLLCLLFIWGAVLAVTTVTFEPVDELGAPNCVFQIEGSDIGVLCGKAKKEEPLTITIPPTDATAKTGGFDGADELKEIQIINNGDDDLFVPSRTSAELSNFLGSNYINQTVSVPVENCTDSNAYSCTGSFTSTLYSKKAIVFIFKILTNLPVPNTV